MTIPYTISQIKTPQFAIFPDKFVNGEKVTMNVSVSFGVFKDLQQIKCGLDIQFLQGDTLLLTTVIECYFRISQEGINNIKEIGKIDVDFLRYVGTIAIGTARGVIAAKTEDTVLNGIVLPPINLVKLIKTDMTLPMQG